MYIQKLYLKIHYSQKNKIILLNKKHIFADCYLFICKKKLLYLLLITTLKILP